MPTVHHSRDAAAPAGERLAARAAAHQPLAGPDGRGRSRPSALYFGTHALDRRPTGTVSLPSWLIAGTADDARQILTTLSAAVITVVGVVFSITIVTLTLASTQFGPRMLRNFIRDRGTQFTLGTFVATFVYATLVLVSIGPGNQSDAFVPHLSLTVAVGTGASRWRC